MSKVSILDLYKKEIEEYIKIGASLEVFGKLFAVKCQLNKKLVMTVFINTVRGKVSVKILFHILY